jgi:hypothetical protein
MIALVMVGLRSHWIWSPRVWQFNDRREADSVLVVYPYRFHVHALETGIATISMPRSPVLPAIQIFPLIHAELACPRSRPMRNLPRCWRNSCSWEFVKRV